MDVENARARNFFMLTIYAVQLDTRWHDRPANLAAVDRMLSAARVEPGAIVVLPEMFDVGFTMDVATANDDPTGQTRRFVADLARRLRSTVIAGLVMNDAAGRAANQALIVGPDGDEVGRYAKSRSFTFGDEHRHYAAGEDVRVFDLAGLKVAPLICYDLRFPELFREAAVAQGAELFLILANWPSGRVEHWTTLARARAIENQAAVVAVNRTGNDPKLAYPGKSLIVDAKGVVLAEADDREQVLRATIDVDAIRAWRRDFPALRDASAVVTRASRP